LPENIILQAHKVRKEFGGLVAVAGISFEVKEHEILAIIGPNGAGKTTLFNLISGIHALDGGEIRFRGRLLNDLPPHQIAALGIARTFQNLQIFANMTVLENVMVGRHPKSTYGFLDAALRLPRARQEEEAIRQEALRYLALVGLEKKARMPAAALPLGQQRLLELARALATEPTLLLLDEPAAGLAASEIRELNALIRQIRQNGMTIILVEHDMSLVMDVADRVIVLNYGEIIATGTPPQVQRNEQVIKAYLGETLD